MNRIPKTRLASNLSTSLRGKIDAYGIAATATAIGIAALASPAQGEVVYTVAHKEIGRSGVAVDFNHDGIADIVIAAGLNFYADGGGMVVYSHHSNRALNTSRGEFVSMLPLGYTVGPNSGKFKLGGASSNYPRPKKFFYYCEANSGGASCIGPWYSPNGAGTSGSYVGVQFVIDGQLHYGWARIRLVVTGRENHYEVAAYLTGYAYETIANKPIIAGKTSGTDESSVKKSASHVEPASLGMLSAGASAIPMWRLAQ
jgi:hypothetical protein